MLTLSRKADECRPLPAMPGVYIDSPPSPPVLTPPGPRVLMELNPSPAAAPPGGAAADQGLTTFVPLFSSTQVVFSPTPLKAS